MNIGMELVVTQSNGRLLTPSTPEMTTRDVSVTTKVPVQPTALRQKLLIAILILLKTIA
jgi:hypothetical protein